MKKFIVLLSLVLVAFISTAQTKAVEVTTDGIIEAGRYVTIWGTSADTLKDADTLTYVLRAKGEQTFDIKIGLYSDFVSGSAGGTLVGYGSLDGVNYFSHGDTIKVVALEADAFNSTIINYADYMWPYLKFIYLQSGTAVTIPKVYAITRKN